MRCSESLDEMRNGFLASQMLHEGADLGYLLVNSSNPSREAIVKVLSKEKC